MPLSINVGLSRKASKDYQSTGVSINVTAELDQSLLAKPDDLQKQIGELYSQAESALQSQASRMVVPDRQPYRHSRSDYNDRRPTRQSRDNYPPRDNGGYDNRRRGFGGNGGNGGLMSQSQRRAIGAIADRLSIDPHLEARDIIGVELDELNIREASELIDHLKSIRPVPSRGNGR